MRRPSYLIIMYVPSSNAAQKNAKSALSLGTELPSRMYINEWLQLKKLHVSKSLCNMLIYNKLEVTFFDSAEHISETKHQT